jgi:hypothetical protein
MKRLSGAIRLLLAVLREIFDESAYSRFLSQYHLVSSPEAYAAFLRQQGSAEAPRHRCC